MPRGVGYPAKKLASVIHEDKPHQKRARGGPDSAPSVELTNVDELFFTLIRAREALLLAPEHFKVSYCEHNLANTN